MADLLPKGPPPFRITGSDLKRGAAHADRSAGGGHPFRHHHAVEDLRSLPYARFTAEDISNRDRRIVEYQPAGTAAACAHQPVNMLHLDTLAAFHQEGGHGLLGIVKPFDLAVDQKQIRAFGPDYKSLLAVEIEHISLAAGACGSCEEIRAAARFG